MDKIVKNNLIAKVDKHHEIASNSGLNSINKHENTSEIDSNLLNLIAEVVVENIVKKLRNGRNRLHQDK